MPPGAAPIVKELWDLAGGAISDAWDTLQCFDLRQGCLTKKLEHEFRRHSHYSSDDVIPLEDDITLIVNCRGLCELVQAEAFTIGHTIFTTSPGLRDEILEHEKRHVRQYETMGDTFWGVWLLSGGASLVGCLAVLPAGGDYWSCVHDTNILEILADW